jgi:hypothetical protein
VFLAIAVFLNAREVYDDKKTYFWLYVGILLLMVVAALPLLFSNWEHNVLIVEASEILLFGVFWAVQTAEQWDEDPCIESLLARSSATG